MLAVARLSLGVSLPEPAEAQQTFSRVADPTVYRTLPVLEY